MTPLDGVLAQLCPILCNPMDCRLLGCSVHGILQARILERVAISSSRRSSQPRDQSSVSCAGRQILYRWATWEALSIKELKTEVLQCFFKYLFQLHKISTFSLARSTFSFFCWSIFSSAAFLVFLPQSFLCFCLSVVCRHSPPALALPSYHFPSSHFKKNNFVHWLFSMFPSYFAFPWATGTIRVEVPRQHGKVTVLPGVDRACATRSGYTM